RSDQQPRSSMDEQKLGTGKTGQAQARPGVTTTRNALALVPEAITASIAPSSKVVWAAAPITRGRQTPRSKSQPSALHLIRRPNRTLMPEKFPRLCIPPESTIVLPSQIGRQFGR